MRMICLILTEVIFVIASLCIVAVWLCFCYDAHDTPKFSGSSMVKYQMESYFNTVVIPLKQMVEDKKQLQELAQIASKAKRRRA